jgi:hypothetical protein
MNVPEKTEPVPTPAQLKPFSLSLREYELLSRLDSGIGLDMKSPGPEIETLNHRGFVKRKGQRLSLTLQGKTTLTAIRALMKK